MGLQESCVSPPRSDPATEFDGQMEEIEEKYCRGAQLGEPKSLGGGARQKRKAALVRRLPIFKQLLAEAWGVDAADPKFNRLKVGTLANINARADPGTRHVISIISAKRSWSLYLKRSRHNFFRAHLASGLQAECS